MAVFTLQQIENIERLAGHSIYSPTTRLQLSVDFSQTVIERSLAIIDELNDIDILISEALRDSYIVLSRGTRLGYLNQIRALKAEGNRLLRELANITQISIFYSKYGNSKITPSYW